MQETAKIKYTYATYFLDKNEQFLNFCFPNTGVPLVFDDLRVELLIFSKIHVMYVSIYTPLFYKIFVDESFHGCINSSQNFSRSK